MIPITDETGSGPRSRAGRRPQQPVHAALAPVHASLAAPAPKPEPVKVATVAPLPEPPPPPVAPAPAAKAEPATPPSRSLKVHTGWIIQVGAFETASEAKQHLEAAQSMAKSLLGHADPFTEVVTKGDKTLYRARFAGLERGQAEATCRQLRRSDIVCMTVKN